MEQDRTKTQTADLAEETSARQPEEFKELLRWGDRISSPSADSFCDTVRTQSEEAQRHCGYTLPDVYLLPRGPTRLKLVFLKFFNHVRYNIYRLRVTFLILNCT